MGAYTLVAVGAGSVARHAEPLACSHFTISGPILGICLPVTSDRQRAYHMPSLAELDRAMLQPGRFVPAVNRLGGGAIAMSDPDRPWRVVGATAAVYQLRQASGRVLALRCPLSERVGGDPSFAPRYQALGTTPATASLRGQRGPLAHDITLYEDGLVLPAAEFRSAVYPVIAMEWITGPTLFEAVVHACQISDRRGLKEMAATWIELISSLRDASFDHGELTPDNVLLRPNGDLALVDYDSVAWKGSPRPPARQPEPNYGHPATHATPVGIRDAFPSLIIYASMSVLARWPSLHGEFGDPPGTRGGALLFHARDLANPRQSPVFATVRSRADWEINQILEVVQQACLDHAAEVPSATSMATRLSSPDLPPSPVLSSSPARPEVRRAQAPTPPAAGAATPRDRQTHLTHLNSLLLAGDEEGARRYWLESGLAADPDAERELGPRIEDVARRGLLQRAREAAEMGDAATLLQLWQSGRFADYRPAAPLLPLVEAARRRLGQVDRLRRALVANDEPTVVRLWPELRGDALASSLAIRAQAVTAQHVGSVVAAALSQGSDEHLIAVVADAATRGVAVSAEARRAQREAIERQATREELREAIDADDRDTLVTLMLSRRLDEVGSQDPATVRAVLRSLAWPHLLHALEVRDDREIAAAYDEELFGNDPRLTLDQRARIDLARKRIAWLAAIRSGLRQRDIQSVRDLLEKTPPGAERRLTQVERTRIGRFAARNDAVARLTDALRDGSDTAILAALSQVEAAGATFPEALDWAAVRGVVDRVTLAEAIHAATTADPPDYVRLAHLLPAARATAATPQGAGIDIARLERNILRTAHLARLQEALQSDDDAAIAAAARPDPYGALAQLSAAQRVRVEQALRERQPQAVVVSTSR